MKKLCELFLVSLLILFWTGYCMADSQIIAQMKPDPKNIKPKEPPPVTPASPSTGSQKIRADLQVVDIYATPCQCSNYLGQVNAMYVDYIAVKVYNAPPSSRMDIPNAVRDSVTTQVKVSFYDMSSGQVITLSQQVTIPPNAYKEVVLMKNTPRLIKKSHNITAWIEIPSNVVLDDPTNNRKVLNDCKYPPVF